MRAELYLVVAAVLLGLGLYGAVARRHLIRKLIALNIAGTGAFLLLVAVAFRNQETSGGVADPVPHAMVLTGIVVAVSVTALAIGLAMRIRDVTGETTLVEEAGLE